MSKVRINDLARELEVKSKSILDALTAVGVTEKKTHSSSIEEDEAEKVRGYLTRGTRPNRPAAQQQQQPAGFNLANVSKPGDALKAILERKQAEQAARSTPPPARPAVAFAPPSGRPAVATPAVAAAARPRSVGRRSGGSPRRASSNDRSVGRRCRCSHRTRAAPHRSNPAAHEPGHRRSSGHRGCPSSRSGSRRGQARRRPGRRSSGSRRRTPAASRGSRSRQACSRARCSAAHSRGRCARSPGSGSSRDPGRRSRA